MQMSLRQLILEELRNAQDSLALSGREEGVVHLRITTTSALARIELIEDGIGPRVAADGSILSFGEIAPDQLDEQEGGTWHGVPSSALAHRAARGALRHRIRRRAIGQGPQPVSRFPSPP